MSNDSSSSRIESDRQMLADARARGFFPTIGAFIKLSGPGWLQSAITLGGGSLASSLYLGILAGFSLMWLQPLAMILGIIMLSAIGYITMSTGERPFRAINEHVNPVLGWGWALAVAAANIVWCLPQYTLAEGVLTQNLLPTLFAPGSETQEAGLILKSAAASFGSEHWMADNAGKLVISISMLILCTIITWSYDRGGIGLKIYETVLKLMVGLIVACFFGVVVVLSTSEQGLDWAAIGNGLIPDFGQLFRPAATFGPLLEAIQDESARQYWSDVIVSKQRDVIISAAATAVGINMTFLFPYSLLRKGWTREFRGLSIFDLSTGMFIPFVLATGCVVIAAGAQFHTKVTDDFTIDEATGEVTPNAELAKAYNGILDAREKQRAVWDAEEGTTSLNPTIELAEKKLAATLVNRKAKHLAEALNDLTGPFVAHIIFGVGVLAMTLSTITLLMLISGFVFAEILGFPPGGWPHKIGALVAGIGGALGPFIWGQASFYLAVPTSVFGFILLPFAYVTFVLLMNQRSLLGNDRPAGFGRLVWNVLMGLAAGIATVGSVYMIWQKAGLAGIGAVSAFILLALMVQINRYNESRYKQ